jgi:tartrate dehydratase alpha subunit/fumarate hydratase class I-like protein
MKVDLKLVEENAKDLYIRALKILPDDVKRGIDALFQKESNARAKQILGTMIKNISGRGDR